MIVIWQPAAQSKLEAQVDYLIEHHAPLAAERLRIRVLEYIADTLALFPQTGAYIGARDLYEVWIPHTKVVIWYRFDDQTVTIIDLWHTSQRC